jgi:heat shock protein HslJ
MMKTLTFLAASTIALSGCVTVPATETSTEGALPATYFALGTEPFWNLEITPTQINLNRIDTPRLLVANPGWHEVMGVRTINTSALTVNVVRENCSDGMSDREYPDRVEVVVGDQVLHGCGGSATARPAASLERSTWRIVTVNGQAAAAGAEADFHFADGRMNGSGGCNRLSGAFTQDRNQLTFGGIAATRMACEGPRGVQEQRIIAILNQPLTIHFGERMTMTWIAPDGSSIALRRLDWD